MFRVEGLGTRNQGLELSIWGFEILGLVSGSRTQASRFSNQGSGFRV